MKKMFGFRKVVMIIVIATAAILLFSFVVMSLWNNVLTVAAGVHVINFQQALGILVLSKILFGGFRGGGGCRGRGGFRNSQMSGKWKNATPEEKEKFKREWRDRCNRYNKYEPGEAAENEAKTTE